jgi:hypothetical protein
MLEKTCNQCGITATIDCFHLDKRGIYGRRASCKECAAAYGARWRRENYEMATAKQRKYREDNPLTPEKARDQMLKRKYRMNAQQYDELAASQNYLCAICRTELLPQKSHVDHDHNCCPGTHTCGECVRGILCGRCNAGIGFLEDDPERMIAAAKYIRKFR